MGGVTLHRWEVVEVERSGAGGGWARIAVWFLVQTVTAHFDWRVPGCCTIYQTDRSQISGNVADENGKTFSD